MKGLSDTSAGPSAVNKPVELTETGFESTKDGRQLLKYLVSCALPEGTSVYTHFKGKRYNFHGELGLAPQWLHDGMDTTSQRWVSGCILARTNYFGQHIRISMRADTHVSDALDTVPEEIRDYPLYEGGFFGNIFSENPVAYTCLGERSEKDNANPILGWRICTKDSGETLPTGEKLSMCDFIITGACSDPKNLTVGGESYKEVIKVYLKPGLSSLCKDHC